MFFVRIARLLRQSLWPRLALCLLPLLLAACESSSSGSSREPNRPRDQRADYVYSRPQLSAVAFVFNYWEKELREEDVFYELDPYDSRMPLRFRQRLQSRLPAVVDPIEQERRVLAFEKVVFPEGDWAYVTYREGNKYHAVEYTGVLRWESDQWELINHYLVAEGLMDPILLDFKWESYRDKYINNSDPTDPASSAAAGNP